MMKEYNLEDIAPIEQGECPQTDYVWLLNLDMVESNTGNIKDYEYVRIKEISNSTVSFDNSNVLYSKLRPYLNKVVLPNKPGYATSEMVVLKPKPEVITREYLTCFLRSSHFVNYINSRTTGAKMPRANIKDLKQVKVPCPSLDMQNYIVELFQTCIKIINIREKELVILDKLVKARFVEMFGDPTLNPMKWEKMPLIDKCDIITGNTPSRKIKEYYGDSIEWIKSDNITESAILTTAAEYLSNEGIKVGRKVRAGSILMTCIAGSLHSIGNVAIADREVAFNQQINAIIPKEQNTYFMYEQLKLSKEYICSGVNMALKGILSKSQLAEKKFIFPPLSCQNQFADFLHQTEKSKSVIQKSLDETQTLFHSLMQEYFG